MAVQQPKTRPVRNCIFCALQRAKSAEHGWSDWAIQRFATPANRIAGQVDGMPFFDKSQKSVTVRCVCVPCNTGWMKGLEDEIIKTVGKMAEGKPSTLTVLEQWKIARWAVAKAMVWEYSTREHPIFYTQEDRTTVMNDGLPPNTVVWLAAHLGRETFSQRRRGVRVSTLTMSCSSRGSSRPLRTRGLCCR
jgi:hypothetical protein